MALLLSALAVPHAAAADPIGSCSGDSRIFSTYPTPCAIGSLLVEGQTATIGGLDVGMDPGLGLTVNQDAYPPEANWLLFNAPTAGALPIDASELTPLEVRYRMSALGGATLSLLDMVLTNTTYFGFTAPVEFHFDFDTGTASTWLLRGGAIDRILAAPPAGATAMDVRVRVFGTAPLGGVAIGMFGGTSDTPAPVPEPGTMVLLGTGLAFAVRRIRRA